MRAVREVPELIKLSAAEQVKAASQKTLPAVVIDAFGKSEPRSTKLDFHLSSRRSGKGPKPAIPRGIHQAGEFEA
jgi:hypothetical protein